MNYNKTRIIRYDHYYLFGLAFAVFAGLIYLFGKNIFFFQEQQSLFIYSGEFLSGYFLKPGGGLEFIGDFFTQFYFNPIAGLIILTSTLIMPLLILRRICMILNPGGKLLIFLLIPSCLILLMQMNYYHLLTYNMGLLASLLLLLASINLHKNNNHYLVILLIPPSYYFIGAYLWVFLAIYIVLCFTYEKGGKRYLLPLFSLAVAVLIVFSAWRFMPPRPLGQLMMFPLPPINITGYRMLLYFLTGYLAIFPILVKLTSLYKPNGRNVRLINWISVSSLFIGILFSLFHFYNSENAKILDLKNNFYNQKWDSVIEQHESSPSRNMVGQYYYNIALSESDQLCDRLFAGKQDFGTNSLVLPWGNEHLHRGAYFYYSIGLINEAHRWAYESKVVNGMTPQNIKLLIKTNLIKGNYQLAEKYVGVLRRTLFYRNLAEEYEILIACPEKIHLHPEFGEKRKLIPQENFFTHIESPHNNILMVFQTNSDNRKAFEYLIAWLLFQKNIEELVNQIQNMAGLKYMKIPRHIEEAILIYYNSTGNFPDLGGLEISADTLHRFEQYLQTYTNAIRTSTDIEKIMHKDFNDTYWYYFHFI